MKVAEGTKVRVARKALRGIEVGRARASIARERAAMALRIKNGVVAKCDLMGDKIAYKSTVISGECYSRKTALTAASVWMRKRLELVSIVIKNDTITHNPTLERSI